MGQRDDLETLRVGLLAAFDEAPVSVKAQIAGQLRQVVNDLAGLGEPEKEISLADEIAARRASRRAGTSDPAPASGRGESRGGRGGHRAS